MARTAPPQRRKYETLGRRFLAILEVGGPRKRNVLRALAISEAQFKSTMRRLLAAGLIVIKTERGRSGKLFALSKKPT